MHTSHNHIKQNTSDSHKVLAVGSLAFDSIRTPSGNADKVLGGSANYFSVAASLFTQINLVGIVGEDFPKNHFNVLKNRGIDLSGLDVVRGETFHWVGEYMTNLNEAQTLSTFLNVFEHFNPIIPEQYKNSEYLFLANIDPDLQRSVHSQVKKPKFVAMDSMNFWIAGKKQSLLKTLELVDLLTINEKEAFLLSNQNNLIDATKTIMKMGPKALVVKRGEYGALLFSGKNIFSAPAIPLPHVKDPTGAGDTFAGGMIGYLAHHGIHGDILKDEMLLRKAVIYGCVMASFTVEDFGLTNLLKVTPEMITERFNCVVEMTKF